MKKTFKSYVAIWGICFVLFNIITFILHYSIAKDSFGLSFWLGYFFIEIAFIGNLFCASIVFKQENITKTFYNISLLLISYSGLVLILLIDILFMLIPQIPVGVVVIACMSVIGFTAIAIIKASVTVDFVTKTDVHIKEQTEFMKLLAMSAEKLICCAKTPETRKHCEFIYEKLRYSDPVSSEKVLYIEKSIENEFKRFTDAIKSDNIKTVESSAAELVILIEERNNKCRLLK